MTRFVILRIVWDKPSEKTGLLTTKTCPVQVYSFPCGFTHGVTGLFLQLRHASGFLCHLILDLVFQGLIFLCLFFFILFVFGFYCALNTQHGGYVRITSLIIIIHLLLLFTKGINVW